MLAVRVTMTAIHVAKHVEKKRVKRGTNILSNQCLSLILATEDGIDALPIKYKYTIMGLAKRDIPLYFNL